MDANSRAPPLPPCVGEVAPGSALPKSSSTTQLSPHTSPCCQARGDQAPRACSTLSATCSSPRATTTHQRHFFFFFSFFFLFFLPSKKRGQTTLSLLHALSAGYRGSGQLKSCSRPHFFCYFPPPRTSPLPTVYPD